MTEATCASCRHFLMHPHRTHGLCRRYPEPAAKGAGAACGEWSSHDGRTSSQVFTHAALEHLTKAQAALARAAHALKEAGKGMAAEAAYRASKEAEQAIEELG